MNRLRRPGVQAGLVALLGGITVFTLAHVVFPHHTTNHDEGVYLQQAAMLLEGQLFIYPPVEESFRPWFFVADGERLYPKYAPVPAAMFAVGKLLGGYRIALGLISTGVLALTYHTVREAFDARTGVVATILMLGSPLFLVEASVFLSYVPTTLWNLGFAAAYLHADRTGSRKTAACAGLAIGIAFFARPYTAVLFATPFIAHALWSLRTRDPARFTRLSLTAVGGLTGVAATLAYNRVVTGSALLFPYEVFAPQDGLGFGYREILGYSREFTPAMSLDANAELLWKLLTQWVVAGPLGTLAAAVGLGAAVRRGIDGRQAALAGVLLTVSLGNGYFWGTVNMLGDLSDPTDGLVAFLGPFYHVDMLVPLTAFGAVGVVAVARWVRRLVTDQVSADRVRPVLLAVALCGAALGGGAAVATAAEPVSDNYAVTQQLEQAYEPFEQRDLDNSLVLLPTPYGDWLNHPFQSVRNDPGFDGDTVYAMQHRQFEVLDAYPERDYYRYVFRGEWVPYLGLPVEPRLQPVSVAEGETVQTDVSASVPEQAALVSIRLASEGENDYATVTGTDRLDLQLSTDRNRTRLTGDGIDDQVSVPTPEDGTVTLIMFVDYGTGAGFEYRAELPVEQTDERVRALTPRLEICRDQRRCGGEAAYVPGTHRDGISMNATTTSENT
ncbi:hypothetical protein Har1131_10040 [Haloarcula sp. CBA1131]|uniref:DUF7846 domain-containing protein n=1 Tax=Haloarcula sp. CBA1131 TaxID=1853686 RepID=UPI0012441234|nr:glycosyltransferase family 39 protein [Haloarcula sp. CBA1131]KAA9407126.1 hypothetical protein Har1131_10040 [Haloarcula sp. CBA1131]